MAKIKENFFPDKTPIYLILRTNKYEQNQPGAKNTKKTPNDITISLVKLTKNLL